jgi:predicted ATPase
VRETGGALEWIWKGKGEAGKSPSVSVTTTAHQISCGEIVGDTVIDNDYFVIESLFYSLWLFEGGGAFGVKNERFLEIENGEEGMHTNPSAYDRDQQNPRLPSIRSVLSMIGNVPDLTTSQPRIIEFAYNLERFAFYRDWAFGAGLIARQPISAGQPIERLEENASNLAQILARYQSDFRPTFDLINELMKKFYEPIKSVEVRIVSTHLQVAILEEGGFSTPAYRLSDGTLRWLALLAILLNPTPGPVTCIEEPELGLHPDMIPTLADLLRDASTRTQLILTTHSQSLVECFSDDPESVCVCEKIDGATRIRRLNREKLSSWLEDYSLGQLWAKGEIGGNRW